jgi:2-phosphoglycerate kinase
MSKTGFSKYDFVKVKVYLSDEHYYILSRFLTCRVLTAVKVHYDVAVRIALDLKKQLVDGNQFKTTQLDLERLLFDLLQAHGYGVQTILLYRLMSRFHHQRIPMLILIGGSLCCGKSTLATALSERLNLPSVLKTDVMYEMLCARLVREVWYRERPDDIQKLRLEMQSECDQVTQTLQSSIKKCLMEGKSVIIEGLHVNAGLLASVNNLWAALQEQRSNEKLVSPIQTHQAIVVPFVIDMSDADLHQQWIANWLSHQPRDCFPDAVSALSMESMANDRLALAQELFESQSYDGFLSLTPITTSNDDDLFNTVLDSMHEVILERMKSLDV